MQLTTALNIERFIDDNQRLEENCRGLKNNCVETKDRITGDQLRSDFIGSAWVEENMKIMSRCPQVRGL